MDTIAVQLLYQDIVNVINLQSSKLNIVTSGTVLSRRPAICSTNCTSEQTQSFTPTFNEIQSAYLMQVDGPHRN